MKKRYVSIPEVKEILQEINKANELNNLQKNTLKYAEDFSKVPLKKLKRLREELLKLDFIDEKYATKLIDIVPKNYEEIRAIFQKDNIVVPLDDIKKILDIFEKI
ncbi:MAG: RNA polymerase Rpb4 family protein [Thermoplasmata archaeon]